MSSNDRPVSWLWIFLAAVVVAVLAWVASNVDRPRVEKSKAPATGRAQRVILISLDTVRADHLSLYGYPRPTTPNLEKLATRAAVFTEAMCHAPYTLPSHMSILTGLYPRAHDVRFITDSLADSHVTIAEALHAAGYKTAAFTDDGFVNSTFGFNQGFDFYDDIPNPGAALTNGFRRYGNKLHEWIRRHREDPFFLFIHSFDCHGPYQVEPRYREALGATKPVVPKAASTPVDQYPYVKSLRIHRYFELEKHPTLEDVVDTYDGTLRFADEQVGKIVDLLDELGMFEDTLLIITSDHGESFLEHGLYVGHGLMLYEEEVHVPLIVKFPAGRFAGVRCQDIVRHVDLFPTITAATGAECPREVQGIDLVPALLGEDREPRIAVGWSPNLWNPDVRGSAGSTHYVRRQNLKFVEPPRIDLRRLVNEHLMKPEEGESEYDLVADPFGLAARVDYSEQMFDLAADPGENTNLLPERREERDRIVQRIESLDRENENLCELFHRRGDAPRVALSDSEIDRLVQQGYISAAEGRATKARQEQDRIERERKDKELEVDAAARFDRWAAGDREVTFTEDLIRALVRVGKIDDTKASELRARLIQRESAGGAKK